VHREAIDNRLKETSFEFFYWFSRFEFALKENEYLKSKETGTKAEPNWEEFKKKFGNAYVTSEEAKQLIQLHPKRQFVEEYGRLEWKPVGVTHCNNDLCKVITMLLTVRNNLFHGGKHGDSDVDIKSRNMQLLTIGKIVLDQLAQLAGFEHSYTRNY